MSDYLGSLYGAVRERLAGTGGNEGAWADVSSIYEAEGAALIPWAELNGLLPYAALTASSMESQPGWGLRNRVFLIQTQIWRVQTVGGSSTSLVAKLEDLRDDLMADSRLMLEGEFLARVLMDPWRLDWGSELMPNTIFAAKGMLMRAGVLSIPVLIGETV